MDITLKNIKHMASLSEETHCYSADLYVEGVKWGEVSNRGHGGPDDFHGVGGKGWRDIEALNARIAAEYPPHEAYGMTLEQDLEMVCGDLVNQHLVAKDFRRAMRTKVMWLNPGNPGVWQLPVPKGRTAREIVDLLKVKQPDLVRSYLVDMPESEALAAYAGS